MFPHLAAVGLGLPFPRWPPLRFGFVARRAMDTAEGEQLLDQPCRGGRSLLGQARSGASGTTFPRGSARRQHRLLRSR